MCGADKLLFFVRTYDEARRLRDFCSELYDAVFGSGGDVVEGSRFHAEIILSGARTRRACRSLILRGSVRHIARTLCKLRTCTRRM